jgi:hypothetical protein
MKQRDVIRSDGTIDPGAYDIVDGCHLWKLRLVQGRPAIVTWERKIFVRDWLMQVEPGRRIRATCRHPLCINRITWSLKRPSMRPQRPCWPGFPTVPCLNAIEYCFNGGHMARRSVRLRPVSDSPAGRVSVQLMSADLRMRWQLAELDRQAADVDLASLPHEEDQHPGYGEFPGTPFEHHPVWG